ncbi:hypothetical protein Rhe02_16250 [Rhizocola hellebori]|uniref:Uncharacterized protein n=1 Tax=Rhizocola hellebori TaxID=1392758 RepID=A0A8J3Q431_9ACTN|nr:hypothetical protein [Rhizocola hellebori]GIH03558.1 hypothetical protein Rhe02_16250 [Rhizocola hellebori]
MRTWIVPFGLLLLAIAVGIFSNWLKPPAKMTGRMIAVVFVVLVLAYSGLTIYGQIDSTAKGTDPTRLPSSAPTPDGSASASPPLTLPTSATPAPVSTGGGAPPGNQGGGGPPVRSQTTGPPPPTGPAYVQASRFRRFGDSYGSFRFETSGTRLTIGSQPEWYEMGAVLSGHYACSVTISFDVRIDPPEVVTAASYGFGFMPRAGTTNDQSSGGLLMVHPSSDTNDIAAWSTEPLPGHGGFGFDWHEIKSMWLNQHYSVAAGGTLQSARIGQEQLDDTLQQSECGEPLFFVWGGATAYLDHILIS